MLWSLKAECPTDGGQQVAEQKPSHIQTIAQILQEAEEYLARTHSVSEWLELEEVLTKAQVELDTIKPQQAALRQVRDWLAGEELRNQQAQPRKLITEGGPPHEQYDVLTAIQERLTQMQELLRSSKQEQPRKVTRPIPVYLTSSRQEQLRGATGPISLYFD